MKTAKTMSYCAFVLVMATLFGPETTLAASKKDFYKLYEDLFENKGFYKKEIRPATNETQPITVYIDFVLNSLIDVDEKEQVLLSSGTLIMSWEDNQLAWESDAYGGIDTILVPQMNIYLPDVIVANSVRTRAQLGFPQQQVRLTDKGLISWEPSSLLVTSCDMDITYFPFDTQVCNIKFETATTTNFEILLKLVIETKQNVVGSLTPNGQWDLVDFAAMDLNLQSNKASVQFRLQLKRRRVFYVLNIVLPVFFISLTASLMFALPADEGEKMGTGITVLLAFAVYLTIVSELVPNTSLQVSILGLYLTTLLGMCAVSVIVCVFILRLHFREEDAPVGAKTTNFTRFLQRITCSRTDVPNKVIPLQRQNTDMNQKDLDKAQELVQDSFQNPLTWKEVSKTLDEFCLIVFTVLSSVITLACLLTLVIGGKLNTPKI